VSTAASADHAAQFAAYRRLMALLREKALPLVLAEREAQRQPPPEPPTPRTNAA
jgi:hypothetical protein